MLSVTRATSQAKLLDRSERLESIKAAEDVDRVSQCTARMLPPFLVQKWQTSPLVPAEVVQLTIFLTK